MDISHILMARGFVYLVVVVVDGYSLGVLVWRVSNTADVSFCLEALDDALARHGRPTIFTTPTRAASSPATRLPSD